MGNESSSSLCFTSYLLRTKTCCVGSDLKTRDTINRLGMKPTRGRSDRQVEGLVDLLEPIALLVPRASPLPLPGALLIPMGQELERRVIGDDAR